VSRKILNKPYPISTQLEKDDAEYISILAYQNHASISQMVRNILIQYIEQHKRYIDDNKI